MSTFMPGMTATNSSNTQPGTFYAAMFFYGFLGVLRAGGMKTTLRSNQKTEGKLVESY